MSNVTRATLALLTLALLCTTGCYRMTILSPNANSMQPTQRGISGTIVNAGVINLTGAVSLQNLCPTGWHRVELAVTPFDSAMSNNRNTSVSFQSFWVYCNSGQRVGVVRDGKGRIVRVFPAPPVRPTSQP